ncbi:MULTISPECIES: hypothetical protein [Sphingobacterium]|uniref:hypothetical protein n=1 Tax=Sphingobacterium TaxID=28453 RepID=UPI00258087C5|nr:MULTISPECIES: hypothetical protein [Sphingobacterium]
MENEKKAQELIDRAKRIWDKEKAAQERKKLKKSNIAAILILIVVIAYYIEYGLFAIPATIGLVGLFIVYPMVRVLEKSDEEL